jgi:hypothetical protein
LSEFRILKIPTSTDFDHNRLRLLLLFGRHWCFPGVGVLLNSLRFDADAVDILHPLPDECFLGDKSHSESGVSVSVDGPSRPANHSTILVP